MPQLELPKPCVIITYEQVQRVNILLNIGKAANGLFKNIVGQVIIHAGDFAD